MLNQYSRLELLLGTEVITLLHEKRAAIFGLGGVGGSCVEALARSGIGTLDVIDNDRVSLTNINRQILATTKTIGRLKVDVAEERIHAIDPGIRVIKHCLFYLPDQGQDPAEEGLDFSKWDYVVDCIDTVTAKIGIILECQRRNIPVISCMGCGNRLDPSRLVLTDIYKTYQDPLARVMRTELRKRGVRSLKVIYSTEPALKPLNPAYSEEPGEVLNGNVSSVPAGTKRRSIPGSSAFVPPAAGLLAASEVIRDLIH